MDKNFYKITLISILIASFFFTCNTGSKLPDPRQAGWNNKAVCELLEDNKNIRVLKCTFEPGVGHEKHYHKRHFGYVIAGSKFRIKDASGIREVNPITNSHFYSDGTDWHEVLNIGDSIAVFLIIEPK